MLFYTFNLDETKKSKFEYLYMKYRALIFHVVYEMIDDEMEAEDVVHTVFIKVLSCLDDIKVDQPLQTKNFLVTIARNRCINMLKKRSKQQVVSWDELEDWHQPYVDAETVFSLPEENRVLTIIENMPPLYKEIFLLKYVNELSDSQIALLLDIKEDSVRKRIYRGKKLLKQGLCERRGE